MGEENKTEAIRQDSGVRRRLGNGACRSGELAPGPGCGCPEPVALPGQQSSDKSGLPDISPDCRRLVTHPNISYTASSTPGRRSTRISLFLLLISSQNKRMAISFRPAFSCGSKYLF